MGVRNYGAQNYMGEFAHGGSSHANVNAYIVANGWADTGDVPRNGMWYYNTTDNKFYGYINGAWADIAGGAYLPLAGGTMTGAIAMGGSKITGLGTPTNTGDAATKDYVDQIAQGIDWQKSIIDQQTTPPGSPSTGDRYIVTATATGAWVGHEKDIAEWNGTAWVFTTPNSGYAAWDESESTAYVYNGTAWVKMAGVYNHNDLASIQGGTTAEYYHLTSAQHTGLTGGGSTTLHIHDGRYYTETELGGTTSGSEGASLIGTDSKTNLGGATTVEAALENLNTKNPPQVYTNAGNPGGVVSAGKAGDICIDTTNTKVYMATVAGTGNWVKIG